VRVVSRRAPHHRGLVVAALLLVAGGLLSWAHTFISDQVTTQLTRQQIFFPPKGEQTADPAIGPLVNHQG
jgi:hypothetical protein